VLRYIELKSGFHDDGPAWIGRVVESKSGRTLYFDGKALKRLKKPGERTNYVDVATTEQYWIAPVKKRGSNRYQASAAPITVEAAAVAELLALLGAESLDPGRFQVSAAIRPGAPPASLLDPRNKL
jgi:hypothetical protein